VATFGEEASMTDRRWRRLAYAVIAAIVATPVVASAVVLLVGWPWWYAGILFFLVPGGLSALGFLHDLEKDRRALDRPRETSEVLPLRRGTWRAWRDPREVSGPLRKRAHDRYRP
jgi:hypothetical protein